MRAVACGTVLMVFVLPAPEVAEADPAVPVPCGPTTLRATIRDVDNDGVLECGPGEKIVVRDEIAKPGADRADSRTSLLSFFLLADFQLGDEELTIPSRTDWRGHPAMLPHMLNAQLAAANRIAAKGGPALGSRYDMAFALGDLADNGQLNETRLVIDLMDGDQLVDPDSGADGYDGRKGRDPRGAGDLRSPLRGESILDLANEPFFAQGLRNADGSPIPWYAVHGNHDSKVMGGIPHEDDGWRKAANEWATGDKKILRLNPRLGAEHMNIRLHAQQDEPDFWMRVFEKAKDDPSSVGDVRTVPADPDRRILSKAEWIDQLARTSGVPAGHGFLPAVRRCPDVYENEHFRRACYSFDHERFRFIALDDNALEGFTQGSIDPAQFEWLEKQLIGASSTYFDAQGRRVTNDGDTDRYIVVLSHHSSKGMDNSGTHGRSNELHGTHLEKLLLRFPNLIIHANGHSHRNRLWPHTDRKKGTKYWEINTASVADHPHNGRSVEIADNGDGTLSIHSVLFDSGVHPNPRNIDWHAHDHTDEVALGDAKRTINEDWLAAAGIEQANAERADKRYGTPADRNVELLMPNPFPVAAPVAREIAAREADVPDDIQAVAAATIIVAIAAWFLNRRRRPSLPPTRRRLPAPQPPTRNPRTPVPMGSRRPAA